MSEYHVKRNSKHNAAAQNMLQVTFSTAGYASQTTQH